VLNQSAFVIIQIIIFKKEKNMLKKSENHMPLYIDLAKIVKNRIAENKYQIGTKIPSEMELQKEFSVSRTTVRKALKVLSDENYLIKLPGKGTFVSDKRNEIETQNQKFSSLTDSAAKTGKKISNRLISIKSITGDDEQNTFLQTNAQQQIIEIKRLRYIDDIPFCLEWIWLAPKYSAIKDEDLDMPLYKILRKKFHINPGKGKKTFKIAFANREESFLLNVDEKTPLMRIKDLVYDDHNFPLHITQEIIRSDKFTYAVNH